MIVVDSSALLAIYVGEPEGPVFAQNMISAEGALIGAPNLVEASMVAEGRSGERGCRDPDELIETLSIKVVDLVGIMSRRRVRHFVGSAKAGIARR